MSEPIINMALAPIHDVRARVEVTSLTLWRSWLSKHHAQRLSVWVVTWKKGHDFHVPYGDIRDEALCFGWIDSVPKKLDQTRSMLLLSPRKIKSGWSAVNKARIADLIAQGRMMEPGYAKIKAAKNDSSWDLLDDAHALIVPADLQQALIQNARAQEAFSAFSPSSRRGILEWIATAKTPQTRQRRIHEAVSLAEIGIRANHPKQK
jgi:uncharacterized protein YdeI (YjbR/CyaY-like superfamily)